MTPALRALASLLLCLPLIMPMTASYYGEAFQGEEMANGQPFDMTEMTAAHKSWPFGTLVEVTRGEESVVVRINDRGPFVEGRSLDLSRAAFKALAPLLVGVMDVQARILRWGGDDNGD